MANLSMFQSPSFLLARLGAKAPTCRCSARPDYGDSGNDNDDDDAFGMASSHRSHLSNCKCEECLSTLQADIHPPVVQCRDGDFAQMKENVLAFMMEERRRYCFRLLALSVEVRSLILSNLLYWHEPLNFRTYNKNCSCRNFGFHTQILATCHQLHDEGSAILMRRNTFMIGLSGDEFRTDTMEWLGFMSTPSVNSQMANWDRFESISKLTVNIKFEDYGRHGLIEEAANGHRLLVYSLVEKILSRTERLSVLNVVCSLYLWRQDVEFALYQVDGNSAEQTEQTGHDGPLTVEQYILEPLVNLKGAADVCSFTGMTADCVKFFSKRTESIEQFLCNQQQRIEMMSNHPGDQKDQEDAVIAA